MSSVDHALGEVFARWQLRTRAPAIVWGLVRAGELVASGGLGTLRVGEEAVPDADSIFRIASMTKSFTGAALMTLVAEGRVRLDDPVSTYVPELEGWRGPTTDGPPLTVRHLASMESGLPGDDPWADRHMDLSPEGLDALVAAGATFAWAPGVRFEYSNLGWGLIGRVIERVAGVRAQGLVTQRLLGPLGMTETTWLRPDGSAHGVAEPYRWEDAGWEHEGEPVGDGTISPMGGLWTSVRQLATWVGFFQDAWPPRDDPDEGPLPRWARREMQQARRMDGVASSRARPDAPSRIVGYGYGIGLEMRFDPRLGEVVGHGGGLPGYGSHMRWIPDRGVGIVALGNVTYAGMGLACAEALDVLADLDELGPRRTVTAAPALEGAVANSVAFLNAWDDADAATLLADNVAPDEAFDRRARAAREVVRRHGTLVAGSIDPETPLSGSAVAAAGLVKIELGLNHAGQVQWLDLIDRSQPSHDPIISDPAHLRGVAGTAYLILRPVADLADAFARWQGEALDRLGGAHAIVPAAHATLKAFGSVATPLTVDDERRIAEVVDEWAVVTPPVELRAEALGVFEGDEWVPIVRLGPIGSLAELWTRAREAGLPSGSSDRIGAEGWVPHLSLVYLDEVPEARRAEVVAWARGVDPGGVSSVAREAELVVFDGGPERRLGRFPLKG